ncbi:MAG TPA: insulinase family protein [Firmicutes bacterium]|nr:insulinase family protein [Bacillota bacterium]
MVIREIGPSGIRVVTETIPYVRSVSIGIWVGAGSRHEPEGLGGITHFIEHLLFKGTKRRNARQIALEVESLGGQLNAFTTKENTCFYAKVLDEHFAIAFDVLCDMLVSPLFMPKHIEMERGVILEEIAMYEDTPDELVHDLFMEACWAGHPLGRNILGEADTVRSIRREDILSYYEKLYTPDNMVIAVAGNVSHEAVMELVARYFSNWCRSTALAGPTFPPTTLVARKIKPKRTEQLHICVGTAGFPLEHPDSYTLHVISSALGGGAGSRLFQDIREERGLAYSVYSYESSYSDGGLFTIYAGVNPKHAEVVIELIRKHLLRVASDGLTPEELWRAKSQAKGGIVLALENTTSRMMRLGRSELSLGRVVGIEEAIRRLEGVSLDDIEELSHRLFSSGKLALAAIGPVDEEGKA